MKSVFSCLADEKMAPKAASLTFQFREKIVPVTFHASIAPEVAKMATTCEPFQTWVKNCEQPSTDGRMIDIRSVEIQSVDLFGKRVGFVKFKSDCILKDGNTSHEPTVLPGICFLRGNSVAMLVVLKCAEDGKLYSLLVDQARIPIGSASVLELPAGMIDPGTGTVAGVAAKEMKEECGITVKESDLIDLTKLAHADAEDKTVPIGIAPSPGGCDEYIRIMYMERTVHQSELDAMNNRLAGLREEGEAITLRVVPYDNMWKLTPDAKAMWYVIAIILDIMCWWC